VKETGGLLWRFAKRTVDVTGIMAGAGKTWEIESRTGEVTGFEIQKKRIR